MSIAKKIIEAHKATIRIESGHGKGTEATVVVPYKGVTP
jgi:signal transduction histidine kinase